MTEGEKFDQICQLYDELKDDELRYFDLSRRELDEKLRALLQRKNGTHPDLIENWKRFTTPNSDK